MDHDHDCFETAAGPPRSRINTRPDAAAEANNLWLSHKRREVIIACRWRDIASLRSLAESPQGFLDDHLRQIACTWLPAFVYSPCYLPTYSSSVHSVAQFSNCTSVTLTFLGLLMSHSGPILLGSTSQTGTALGGDFQALKRHRDEDQVQLDVNRSFAFYQDSTPIMPDDECSVPAADSLMLRFSDQSEAELELRKELSSLITQVLRRFPFLCYFQGFHDICQVFMLVLNPPSRANAVARLAVLRIRDFMLPSLEPTTAQLRLLPDIIAKADPQLRRHIAFIEPFYALAGTLTMYAHNIEDYRDTARLFDVLLAYEPVFSVYVFAQIVLDRRDEILQIDEPDMLHVFLAKVPSKMNLDTVIAKSVRLFHRSPPELLRHWSSISDASALKTARDINICATQTLDEGHAYFQKQVKEIWWLNLKDDVKKTIERNRRPLRFIAMAVAGASVAILLQSNTVVVQNILAMMRKGI